MLRWTNRSRNDIADNFAKVDIPSDASYEFYYIMFLDS